MVLLFFLLQDHFISVIIENGHLVFRYKLDSEPAKEIARNTAVVNDGTYQQVCSLNKQMITYSKYHELLKIHLTIPEINHPVLSYFDVDVCFYFKRFRLENISVCVKMTRK